jgi:hypothetical protein
MRVESSSSRGADPRAYVEDRAGGFDRGFPGPVPAEGPPPYEAYVQDRYHQEQRFHDGGQYGVPQHQQQQYAQQGGYRPVEEQRGGAAGYGREGEFWAPTEVPGIHRGRQPRYGSTPGYVEQQDPYPRKGYPQEAPPTGYYQWGCPGAAAAAAARAGAAAVLRRRAPLPAAAVGTPPSTFTEAAAPVNQ